MQESKDIKGFNEDSNIKNSQYSKEDKSLYKLSEHKGFFVVKDHIYFTYFNTEIIILDLRKDQYIILSEAVSKAFNFALSHEFKVENKHYVPCYSNINILHLPEYFNESILYLTESKILSNKLTRHSFPRKCPQINKNPGAFNVDWRLNYADLQLNISNRLLFESLYYLIKSTVWIKILGLHSFVKFIKRKKHEKYQVKDDKDFNNLAVALNKACFYFPLKTKCLEWSGALTLMGLRRGWKCNLEIGVQNLPFTAHAWVKANNMVIADDNDLPTTLSVILSEPFF